MNLDNEVVVRAQRLQQESVALEERNEFVTQQASELVAFTADLKSFANTGDKEILASIGKGIFVKAKTSERELFVDVGAGILIKKKIDDVQRIIADQLRGLEGMREETLTKLNELHKEFENIISQIEKSK